MDAPLWGDTGGHTGTALPISIIFFHASHTNKIPSMSIRPYQSPKNHAVYHYPIGVILSKAQGWQVQRSLPWVTMQARRLPPWGLYFFSSQHNDCLPHTHSGGGNTSRTPAPILKIKKCVYRYDFGVTVDDTICFKTSYDLGVTVASP